MRLDDYLDGFERDETADLRKLAEEKSYAITDHVEAVESRFDERLSDDTLVGSTSPSIFVGRSNYPRVSTGLLSPVGDEGNAASYTTSGDWYEQGYSIDDVFQKRTGLLNSGRSVEVEVGDAWDGFVGVQREVAIADRPVDVEVGLDGKPEMDLRATIDDVGAPTGPRAQARSADLTENPHVPRAVEKTLSDDDWRAEGAMTYLYRQGFDVYDIDDILSAGALGQAENRRLVPTRWSITAVDDTVGQYLRGQIHNAPSVDEVRVYYDEYVGNQYWVVLAPGTWEFELVEMKAPGSIWNPDAEGSYYVAADREGYEGRTDYVDETAGAYYASRLGVLERLAEEGRQAKAFVLRHATTDYWAPVGVWQIRESVRAAVDGEYGEAETFHDAVRELAPRLPISMARLRRKSNLVAGVQSSLAAFGGQEDV
ncbi:DNA repair protein NreA [Halorarius halobius]|uniref:DNA repair protein NreA n=1 Tax=Halorarius halobius TaxID=2962671 RepID=UPI0020CE2C0D|nr:DNA repair protein NreA [Halorarius halobius]